jgi:hypothetical protein
VTILIVYRVDTFFVCLRKRLFLEDEIFTLHFNPGLNHKFWPAAIWIIFLAEENLKHIPGGDNGTFQRLSGCPSLLAPTAV